MQFDSHSLPSGFENCEFLETFRFSNWYLVALFLKTEMDGPPLNFTWSTMWFISFQRRKRQTFPALHKSAKSIQSIKTVTDSSGPKISILFKIPRYPWHHPIDKKYIFFSVKIENRLSILQENTCPRKSDILSGGGSLIFQNDGVSISTSSATHF